MAFLTDLPLAEAQRIGGELGVEVASIEPLDAGSVNSNFLVVDSDGGRYFARVYEEQGAEGAANEVRLLRGLAARGIPVAEPASDRLGEYEGKPVTFYPWVDGDILCQASVTPHHCREVGSALARIHAASGSLEPIPDGRFGPEHLEARLDRIEVEASADLVEAARQIRAALTRWTARRDPSLPSGLVHEDLFRDNVLWAGERIAALIDFESASRGSFAYDLMVTVEAWCFGDRFRPELVQAMFDGYRSERVLSSSEREALVTEGALAALRFATTRITDFTMRAPEGEPPKRDFRRFLSRLRELEDGALQPALATLHR